MTNKTERLKVVLSKINQGYEKEHNFDNLYRILQEEYQIEKRDCGNGTYCNNLRQTIEKQAEEYLLKKGRRPIKGAPEEYRSFVSHFRTDVMDELPIPENK